MHFIGRLFNLVQLFPMQVCEFRAFWKVLSENTDSVLGGSPLVGRIGVAKVDCDSGLFLKPWGIIKLLTQVIGKGSDRKVFQCCHCIVGREYRLPATQFLKNIEPAFAVGQYEDPGFTILAEHHVSFPMATFFATICLSSSVMN